MELSELLKLYKKHPAAKAMGRMLVSGKQRVCVEGMQASSMSMIFASLVVNMPEVLSPVSLFVMDDREEAGYLYHDMVQVLGEERVMFFPSSFRRAVKYGQRDAANEILRTEVLARLAQHVAGTAGRGAPLFVVSYPEALAGEPDSLSTDIFLDKEDSYIRNYKKPGKDRKKYVRTDALCITGPEFERPEIALIHGHMPVSALKEVCHRYGTTINTYLTAVYVWSIYKSVLNGRAGEKPIRCAVPVNLRPYYDSHTLKNFFAIIGAEFLPDREGYTFPEILEIVSDSLKSQMNRSNFDEIISYNVSNEMNMMLRIVPLFIKNFAIKQVFSASSHSYSTTMTNVGPVKVREPYKPYIKGFSVMLSMSEGQNIKAAIISYEDLLTVTFSSCLSDTSIQRCFFQELTKEGIPVTIETNGMYGEA